MKKMRFAVPVIAALLLSGQLGAHDRKFVKSVPRVINPKFSIKHLKGGREPHQVLFEGFKESVGIESGKVTMARGQEGEKHNTEIYEEVLIILEGKGSIEVDGDRHTLKEGDAVYIPPHCVHQLINDRSDKFEYIYVAAPTFIPAHMEVQPLKQRKKNVGK